jgi:hypothetical protein
MAVRRIPLFPLNVAVFPRTALPLHIFEGRHKEIVAKTIQDRTETTRLKELTRYLAAYPLRQRQIERAKGLARRNGHAQAPAEPER